MGNNNFGDKTSDLLVKYTGVDLMIGEDVIVNQGDTYDVILPKLVAEIKLLREEKVAIKCLQDGTCGNCDSEQRPVDAISTIVAKLCNINVGSIKYDGHGKSSLYNAKEFHGKEFRFSGTPTETNYTYAYDASEFQAIEGFSYVSLKTYVDDELFRGSKNVTGSFTVPFSSFPFRVDVEVLINTKEGSFILSGAHTIGTPISADSILELNLRDGRGSTQYSDLSGWMVDMENSVSQVMSYISGLKKFTDENLNGTGIKQLISSCGGQTKDNRAYSEDLNKVTFKACDGCDQSESGSIQKALSSYGEQIASNSSNIAKK